MNLSEIIVNMGANSTAEMNCSAFCDVSHAFTEAVNSRILLMALIMFSAVAALAVSYRLMLKGRISEDKWFKHIFEPAVVALLITSIFMLEVFIHGLY